jgi:uncharacterized protein with HEPN domain
MIQSDNTDLIYINKLRKYIVDLKETYNTLGISNADELAENTIGRYAITQIITNIYEDKLKIQEKALIKIPLINKISLKTARHIASHDYGRVDFDIIFKRTEQLLKPEVLSELEAVINDFEKGQTSDLHG